MIKRIPREILICQKCKSRRLNFNNGIITCENCSDTYTYKEDRYFFSKIEADTTTDSFDKIKYIFKKFSFFYQACIWLISPVYINNSLKRFIKKYINKDNLLVLNLGSGNSRIGKSIINIDLLPYKNVHMTCDLSNIPILDNSVDVVINIAVLEHVPNPELVVGEISRILKNGGIVYSFVPFIQGFHASPADFSRRTYEGMKILYKNFDMIEIKPGGGPTSGFLWIFQEWISLLFSFGIKPLHLILNILLILITFPLKFLDILLVKHPLAKNISSGFIYIGRKPNMNSKV